MRRLLVIPVLAVLLSACSPVADTPSTVTVPDVIGQSGDDASYTLGEAGLVVEWDAAGGIVILASSWTVEGQDPEAGAMVPEGSIVTLVVSRNQD